MQQSRRLCEQGFLDDRLVAGSVEAFLLIANGQLGLGHLIVGFLIPVFLGNIVGGTALSTLLSYAQVMNEAPISADRNRPPA